MKRTTHRIVGAIGAAALLAACLGPVELAVETTYREPRNNLSAFTGMLNDTQQRHLRSATFPRLTQAERKLLRRVNAEVNHTIRYLSDRENYAVADRAVTEPAVRRPLVANLPPARYGDCEDYALTKKHRLTRSGFSATRAFVALAVVPEDGRKVMHSVLAVPEGGEWHILNNWDNQIQRAGSLQRWWDWTFIRPRYDSYLLAMQMRRVSEQTDAARPASGGGARARE
jgi:predicted transglutaminase-like cysteine proteinase